MSKRLTTEEFKKILHKIHPNLIIKGEYINANKKILVEDDLGIEYYNYPLNLLRIKTISITTAIDKNKAFELKARVKHNTKYEYNKVQYVNGKTPVLITCPEHGDFLQNPINHLNGHGCRKCSTKLKKKLETYTLAQFINKSNILHDYKYSYSKTQYISSKTKVIITCPIHGDFLQKPDHHLQGHGCTKCAAENTTGTGHSKASWLYFCQKNKKVNPKVYIIHCFNASENFIKIGITSNSIYKRFKYGFPYSYEVLKELKGSPDFVWDKEKELHRLCKSYKYKPKKSFGGETECFTTEIAKLLSL